MEVAIIGAGRNRNGIGEYIGKYFHKNGAHVISVLGTTTETTRKASLALRKYGIEATPYTDFYTMVVSERPDTVVIASPSSTHYEYLIKSIEARVNVFCEKPFIWQETNDIRGTVEDIFERANSKRLTVAMNSQWPFSIQYYEKLCGPIDVKNTDRFFISMSPIYVGKDMIPESLPHALSMLYFVFGDGAMADLHFEPHEEKMIITFKYVSKRNTCDVLIRLVRKEQQPRDFLFGFNDRIVSRILHFEKYDIYFHHKNKKMRITDPLELSVQDFMEAMREKREPLIGYPHIVSNISSVKEIYDRFEAV